MYRNILRGINWQTNFITGSQPIKTLKKQNIHRKAHFYISLLIAFFLPLARFVPLFIFLLLLNWLIEGDFKNKFKTITASKFALLFCFFYILHLIGLLYTANLKSGSFDIQVKLSLFIFPVLFASRPLERTQLKPLFLALLAGGITSSFILLTRAIVTYFSTGENIFFYESFSAILIHPSYLAMYLNLVIAWVIIQLYYYQNVFGLFSKSISIAMILYFSFILVLLSSKLGLLTLALIYLISFIHYSRRNHIIGIAGLLLIVAIGLGIIKFVPEIKDRVKTAVAALTTSQTNSTDTESTAVRLLIWKAANQVIADHLLIGTGTGDSKDELIKEYERRGMTGAIHNRLNAHNEYYQVFVSIGLTGFIIFFMQLFWPLAVSVKNKTSVYTAFLLIVALNFLTESMLESEAGVLFYAFFNSVLCFTYFSKNLISNSNDTIFTTTH